MTKKKTPKAKKSASPPAPPWVEEFERRLHVAVRHEIHARMQGVVEGVQLGMQQVVTEIHTLNKRFGEGSYTFHQALQDVGYYKAKAQEEQLRADALTRQRKNGRIA